MKCLVLSLEGDMANWRKFYANSSSLTYYFPTRTNILGIIGSILCLNQREYLSRLSHLGVSVIPQTHLRKEMFTMNYRNTKNYFGEYTQIKLEIILPPEGDSKVRYHILLFSDSSDDILEDIQDRIVNNRLGYGVYLGQRSFRGNTKVVSRLENTDIIKSESDFCDSVATKESIEGDITYGDEEDILITDKVPSVMSEKREIEKTKDIIFSSKKGKIKIAEGKIDTYKVRCENLDRYIVEL